MQARAIAIADQGKKDLKKTAEDAEETSDRDDSALDSGADTPQRQASPGAVIEELDECKSCVVTSPPGASSTANTTCPCRPAA